MAWLVLIPFVTFCLLMVGEWGIGRNKGSLPRHDRWDWVLNLSGFVFQGAIIPIVGFLIATRLLPAAFPGGDGSLQIGWWGAFLLNFVFVDFLFYWQHRLFHRSPALWKLHRCHHSARRVDVWITSRNTLLIHFFFVYLIVNPLLGYLVDHPAAFFTGAAITASLDLLRHANLDYDKLPFSGLMARFLGNVIVLPSAHHRHHARESEIDGNFGANLIIWDSLFGTRLPSGYPDTYGVEDIPHPAAQLCYPFYGESAGGAGTEPGLENLGEREA